MSDNWEVNLGGIIFWGSIIFIFLLYSGSEEEKTKVDINEGQDIKLEQQKDLSITERAADEEGEQKTKKITKNEEKVDEKNQTKEVSRKDKTPQIEEKEEQEKEEELEKL